MNIVQIYKKFPTEADCIKYLEEVKRKGTPKCPYCNSTNTTPMEKEQRHHCNRCNTTFSVTVSTIFHHTRCDLQKWFLAISLMLNAKKGLSARQLARDIEVNPNTAWYMNMRIRKAMLQDRELMSGIVEMDETYVGGNPKNQHASEKEKKRGRGTDKTPVVGIVQRGGKVSAKVSKDVTGKTLSKMAKEKIDNTNTIVMTDQYPAYKGFAKFVEHQTVNHAIKQYVDGNKHTNTIEGFWSLLKRGIIGQYHNVSKHYLNRYIDEFCFRYNNRKSQNLFNEFLFISVTI